MREAPRFVRVSETTRMSSGSSLRVTKPSSTSLGVAADTVLTPARNVAARSVMRRVLPGAQSRRKIMRYCIAVSEHFSASTLFMDLNSRFMIER